MYSVKCVHFQRIAQFKRHSINFSDRFEALLGHFEKRVPRMTCIHCTSLNSVHFRDRSFSLAGSHFRPWSLILRQLHFVPEKFLANTGRKTWMRLASFSIVNRDHMGKHDIERPKSGPQNILSIQKCHQAIFQYWNLQNLH